MHKSVCVKSVIYRHMNRGDAKALTKIIDDSRIFCSAEGKDQCIAEGSFCGYPRKCRAVKITVELIKKIPKKN